MLSVHRRLVTYLFRGLTKLVCEWTAASEPGEAHPQGPPRFAAAAVNSPRAHPQRPPHFVAAAVNSPRTPTKPALAVGRGLLPELCDPQARFQSPWPLPRRLGPAFLPPTGAAQGQNKTRQRAPPPSPQALTTPLPPGGAGQGPGALLTGREVTRLACHNGTPFSSRPPLP